MQAVSALQIVNGIKALYRFWESIEEAPQDVCNIIEELKLLECIILDIGRTPIKEWRNSTLEVAMVRCAQRVRDLQDLICDLESGFSVRSIRLRKWTAVKAVFRHDKIVRFSTSLEEAKSSLMLAVQCLHSISMHQAHMRFDEIADGLATLRHQDQVYLKNSRIHHMESTQEAIRTLLSAGSNPIYRTGIEQAVRCAIQNNSLVSKSETYVPNVLNNTKEESPKKDSRELYPKKIWVSKKTWKTPFGTIDLTTEKLPQRSNASDRDDSEYERTFEFHPSLWFLASGIRIGLRSVLSSTALGGGIYWRTFRAAPNDALIFQFCEQGNIDGVRLLLQRGDASVWDMDPSGRMPLHYAAQGSWDDITKLLLDAGAPVEEVDRGNFTPIVAAIYGSHCPENQSYIDHVEKRRATYRLLNDKDPLPSSSVLYFLSFLAKPPWRRHKAAFTALISEVDPIYPECSEEELRLLQGLAGTVQELIKGEFSDAYRIACDAVGTYLQLLTNLHESIIRREPVIDLFLKQTSNPHAYAARDKMWQIHLPKEETTTSLAMYNSATFSYWRDALIRSGRKIDRFIEEELGMIQPYPYYEVDGCDAECRKSPLLKSGWTISTLRSLFSLRFTPSLCDTACSSCKRALRKSTSLNELESMKDPHALKQPSWLYLLNRLKNGELRARDGYFALEDSDISQDVPLSSLCAEDPEQEDYHLCCRCWNNAGYEGDFWDVRDITRDQFLKAKQRREDVFGSVDEDDSPFLLSF